MEYCQTLLEVLWWDIWEFGIAVIAFALALAFPSYWLSFLTRALIDGTPREIIWKGTLWGWFGGIVSFVIAKFGMHTVGCLMGRYLGFDWDAIAFCFLLGCFVSFLSSAIYFQRCRRMNGVEVPQRWAYSLRTFVVAQLMLALLIGGWITTRRQEIESRIALRRQMAELNRRRLQKQACEVKFRPYGWTVYIYPDRDEIPHLRLLRYDDRPLQGFSDQVLQEITPAEQIIALHIASEALTDEGLKTIGTFTTLENLRIASSQITDAGLVHLRNLHNLKELSIGSDRVTDAGVAQLRELPALERLEVQSTELTEVSLTHFAAIEGLKYGTIYGSQITPAQQREFLLGRENAQSKIYASDYRRPYPPRPPTRAVENTP